MTAPDANPRESVRVLAALHVLNLAHSAEFPPVADQALSDGLYSDSLMELATIVYPTKSEVVPLLARAMTELGMPMPSPVEAAWCVAEHCTRRIASGDEDPIEPIQLLNDVAWASRDMQPPGGMLGGALDLERLIFLHWFYFEPREDWHFENLKNIFEINDRMPANERGWKAILDRLSREESCLWLARRAANVPPRSDTTTSH